MKYTESTRFALGQESVQRAFDEAKASKTPSSQVKLGREVNKVRARYLKDRGYSNTAIAQELEIDDAMVQKIL